MRVFYCNCDFLCYIYIKLGEVMQCYGREYGKLTECATCEYADYCKDAGDLPVSSHIQYDDARNATAKKELVEPERSYSAQQMAELFRRLIYLDDERLRKIIQMKLENPSCSLSEIGRLYGISKQAIHQYAKKATEVFPELKVILHNRPMYNRWRGTIQLTYKKRKPRTLFAEQLTFNF